MNSFNHFAEPVGITSSRTVSPAIAIASFARLFFRAISTAFLREGRSLPQTAAQRIYASHCKAGTLKIRSNRSFSERIAHTGGAVREGLRKFRAALILEQAVHAERNSGNPKDVIARSVTAVHHPRGIVTIGQSHSNRPISPEGSR
jgi:hypothetical protein